MIVSAAACTHAPDSSAPEYCPSCGIPFLHAGWCDHEDVRAAAGHASEVSWREARQGQAGTTLDGAGEKARRPRAGDLRPPPQAHEQAREAGKKHSYRCVRVVANSAKPVPFVVVEVVLVALMSSAPCQLSDFQHTSSVFAGVDDSSAGDSDADEDGNDGAQPALLCSRVALLTQQSFGLHFRVPPLFALTCTQGVQNGSFSTWGRSEPNSWTTPS